MRSLVVLFWASFAAGIVSGNATTREVAAGASFDVIVVTFGHEVTDCHLTTPGGETVHFKPEDTSGDKYLLHEDNRLSACSVAVQNVERSDNGVWTLYAVDGAGIVLEKAETISVIETDRAEEEGEHDDVSTETDEDKANTTEPTYEVTENPQESVPIDYLTAQSFDSSIGLTVETGIQQIGFRELDKCVVRLPNGQEYDVDDLDAVSGVASYSADHVYCGVSVHVTQEFVGEWLLMATETVWGYAHEQRRLPFSIHVEEFIEAASPKVIVSEGNDFYLRLADAVEDSGTCRLDPPHAVAEDKIQVDEDYQTQCGFIVRDVQASDAGVWNIKHGNDVVYTAPVTLTVTVTITEEHADLVLVRNQPAAELLGAADAVYCILEDPSGSLVYHGFGQCQLNLERVTLEHEGIWLMRVATPGRVFTDEYTVAVKVSEPEPKAAVATSVEVDSTTQRILCSVTTAHALLSCVFQNDARVLISSDGVGEDGYKFYGNGSSFVDGLYHHSCGLEFGSSEPRGVWRCAIETDDDTYYGFLSTDSASDHEPTLSAPGPRAPLVAGDAATLTCSARAPLRYCYYRARNGSVYSVEPGTSSPHFSYAGAGLDAGDCGIRLTSVAVRDAGRWSCHAGVTGHADELTAVIEIEVKEKLSAEQHQGREGLAVTAQAWGYAALEYCRFVRIDGVGFTSDALPRGYTDISDLERGFCGILIISPSIVEHHPWTVVARLVQHRDEISGVTEHTMVFPSPGYYTSFFAFYCFITVFGALLILAGVMMIPKRNRDWTYSRASNVGSSIRRSFRKPVYFTRKPVDITREPVDIIKKPLDV